MSLEKQINESFLNVPLRPETMLIFTARTAILESVKDAAKSFRGKVLDVGCGFQPYRNIIESNPHVYEYIGMDLENSELYAISEPDLKWNGRRIALEDESVDCVMATEFLEHYSEPEKVLAEILRVMKSDGRFFATVPFIWNLHEIPHDEYRFTPYSLTRHLANAGFKDVEVKALGGWNLSLAQMIGLWISFSKMRNLTRRILRVVLFPVYYSLIKTDRKPVEFDGVENSMFSGLSVTATK